jgi:hypothetical protein
MRDTVRTGVALAITTLVLVACNERQAATASAATRDRAVPPIDRGQAAGLIAIAMREKRFNDYIGDTYRCADFFKLENVTYTADRIEGTTAKVEVRAVVRRLPIHGGIQSISANDAAGRVCYGAPPSGWTSNMMSAGAYIADFELWGREWRMVGAPRNRDVR